MDMLFFGDTGGTSEDYGGSYEAGVSYGAKWPWHDMAPMIPLMAKAASGVGFAITMSTIYHHPFLRRAFLQCLGAFLEVACKLWDSVEKDALVADREKGIFADPARCTGSIIAGATSMCAVRCRHYPRLSIARLSSRPSFPGLAWISRPPTRTRSSARVAQRRGLSRTKYSAPRSAKTRIRF
jgi:hypothetical protein